MEHMLGRDYFIDEAIYSQHKEVVEIIIRDTDTDVGYGLLEACRIGNLKIIELLLSYESRIEAYYWSRMPETINLARRLRLIAICSKDQRRVRDRSIEGLG